MSEISLKSPHFKQRDVDYVKVIAKFSVGGHACVTQAIDIPGLTIAQTGATTFTLSGFEAESDLALDSSRIGGLSILATGTLSDNACAVVDVGDISVESVAISGTAGSRIATVTVKSVNLDLTADGLTDALGEFVLPIKNRDF